MDNCLRVTVCVPTYMRDKFVLGNVKSILANSYPDFELIVVDQSPTRSTESILLREFGRDPRFRYMHVDWVAQSYARNVGLREALGELILYTDDDVLVPPNWVQSYVDCYTFLRTRGITPGTMGGPVEGIWEAPKPSWWPKEFLYCLNEFDLPGGRQEYPAGHYPCGSNFAFPTSLVRAVGGFDERIGYFSSKRTLTTVLGEDTRVVLQLARQGYRPYFEPDAGVYHIMVKERLTRPFFYRRVFGAGVDNTTISLEFKEDQPVRLLVNNLLRLARRLLRITVGRVHSGTGGDEAQMRDRGYALMAMGSLLGAWIWFRSHFTGR